MNIATELLSGIRARSIDSFYAIEESLMEGRSISQVLHESCSTRHVISAPARLTPSIPRSLPQEDKTTLVNLIKEGGTPEDRLRLLLLMHLHPTLIPAPEQNEHYSTLQAQAGCDLKAFETLKRLVSESASAQAILAAQRGGGASSAQPKGKVLSNVMRMADKAGQQHSPLTTTLTTLTTHHLLSTSHAYRGGLAGGACRLGVSRGRSAVIALEEGDAGDAISIDADGQ